MTIEVKTKHYSTFKVGLERNLERHRLTIQQVIHMPPFAELDQTRRQNIAKSVFAAADPSNDGSLAALGFLSRAVEEGVRPVHLLLEVFDAVAREAEQYVRAGAVVQRATVAAHKTAAPATTSKFAWGRRRSSTEAKVTPGEMAAAKLEGDAVKQAIEYAERRADERLEAAVAEARQEERRLADERAEQAAHAAADRQIAKALAEARLTADQSLASAVTRGPLGQPVGPRPRGQPASPRSPVDVDPVRAAADQRLVAALAEAKRTADAQLASELAKAKAEMVAELERVRRKADLQIANAVGETRQSADIELAKAIRGVQAYADHRVSTMNQDLEAERMKYEAEKKKVEAANEKLNAERAMRAHYELEAEEARKKREEVAKQHQRDVTTAIQRAEAAAKLRLETAMEVKEMAQVIAIDEARAEERQFAAAELARHQAEHHTSDQSACTVCYDKQADHMPFTCQHVVLCGDCVHKIVNEGKGCLYCNRKEMRPQNQWRIYLP